MLKHILLVSVVLTAYSNTQAATPTQWYERCLGEKNLTTKQLTESTTTTQPAKMVGLFVSDKRICSCIKKTLSSPSFQNSANEDDSLKSYLRAEASCFSTHYSDYWPETCSGVFREVLATVGRRNTEQNIVDEMCNCTAGRLKENLTADSIYEASLALVQAVATSMKTQKPLLETGKPGVVESTLKEVEFCGNKYLKSSPQR